MKKSCSFVIILFYSVAVQSSENGPIKDAAYFGITPTNDSQFFSKACKLTIERDQAYRRLMMFYQRYQKLKDLRKE